MPVVLEPTGPIKGPPNTPAAAAAAHFQRALLPLLVREVKVEPVLFLISLGKRHVTRLEVEVEPPLVQLVLREVLAPQDK
jgi:hypothetical protein